MNAVRIHPCITSLPHDILHAICIDVCSATKKIGTKSRNFEHFQLTCSQFCTTAVSIPQLWSCVDDRMDVDRMGLQLRRCGSGTGMSFRIVLEDYPPPPCMCPRWEFIKTHKARWTSGDITLNYDLEEGHECLDTLLELEFPSLTSITLELRRLSGCDIVFNWSMPRLEEMVCRSSTWESSLLPCDHGAYPQLKRLKVVNENPEIDSMDTSQLLVTLATPTVVGQVRELTLDFSRWGAFQGMGLVEDDEKSIVRLPSVESLNVDIVQDYDDTVECEFLHHVVTPKVKYVRVRIGHYSDMMEWLSALQNPRLERVEVVCMVRSYSDRKMLKERILQCFDEGARDGDVDDNENHADVAEENPGLPIIVVAFEEYR